MTVEIASSPSAPRNDDPSGSKIVETAFAGLRPFGASGALGRGLTYNDYSGVNKNGGRAVVFLDDFGWILYIGANLFNCLQRSH